MDHQYNATIFREYDIRGVFNETLFTEDAYNIGRAYATLVKNGTIAVGYDGRASSPELSSQLIKGLTDSGVNVIALGLVPTPLTYFAVFHMKLAGAIMVTGSHNPPSHNGFKIMLGKDSLHGPEIKNISTITKFQNGNGKVENKDLSAEYINKILSPLNGKLDLKIGWDPANGAACNILSAALKKLGKHENIIHEDVKPVPTHPADPTHEENLTDLIALVKDKKLDVGFAFDGDADRVGIIDDLGRPIWGDQILAILAKGVLKKHPGASIVADVKTSEAVFNYIAEIGGKPVMWKTGHSLVKAKMKELKSPLAGEMSAHIFIGDDYYGYDDGIYAAIRFIDVMLSTGKKASELLDELPKMHSSPEYRITCSEERKFAIVDELKAKLKKAGTDFSEIDGIRTKGKEGWWLLRASNTGAQLVARAESATAEGLQKLKDELTKYLAEEGLKIS